MRGERERGREEGTYLDVLQELKKVSFIFLLLSLCLGVWFCFSFDLIIFKANQLRLCLTLNI